MKFLGFYGWFLSVATKIKQYWKFTSLLVGIADSEKGISPEIVPRIFEPFFTTKPPGDGCGLGLDRFKKIIERHTGKIEVNFVAGKTIFTVSIPIVF